MTVARHWSVAQYPGERQRGIPDMGTMMGCGAIDASDARSGPPQEKKRTCKPSLVGRLKGVTD